MTYRHSVVFLAANADYADGRDVVKALGYDIGGGVPDSTDAYRFGHAWVDDRILGLLNTRAAPALSSAGLDVTISAATLPAMVDGQRVTAPREHLAAVLDAAGLSEAESAGP